MARESKLTATTRTGAGTSVSNRLRRQGLMPGVVNDSKGKSELVQVSQHEFERLMHDRVGEHVVLDLVVDGGRTFRPAAALEKSAKPGWYSRNWMLPVVHEQYGFWMPSARNTGLMIETYWHAYVATRKEVYRAKALSIANNFTRVQQAHDGDYPTMFTTHPMNFWINNSIYPARVMMRLQQDLDAASTIGR